MILKETFDKSRITSFRSKYKNADPGILDKMIHSLTLLEELTISGLDFIFKGGTSLVLLLQETHRFSTDIDIVTESSIEEIQDHLDKIVSKGFFTKWKLDEPRSKNSKIPKAHFEIFFQSQLLGKESEIILDVLFSTNPYPTISSCPIESEWLVTSEPISSARIPSVECILGDKLTAFAPVTTGIPYGKNKDVEMIKQLFDISILIDRSQDFKTVRASFLSTAEKEIGYRNNKVNVADIIEDVFQTALILARREKNSPGHDIEGFGEMQQGIKKIEHFAANHKFHIEEAIAASAKAAYLLCLFSKDATDSFMPYSESVDMTSWSIANTKYNFLNRFIKTNRPAFYYWYSLLKERGEL
jgi:hypothetical protein